MAQNSYLKWLASTQGFWWNDSADLRGMDQAIENGATGVTTNPILVRHSLYGAPDFWAPYLSGMDPSLSAPERAEETIRRVTVEISKKFLPVYEGSMKTQGFVCAQVNPAFAGNTEKMVDMGRRLARWAPNIAVKLPGTAAGLDALEECAALGFSTVGTVSFTVPQAMEIARRQTLGAARARKAGIGPGQSFSVIMAGRQDDYLRDIAQDSHADATEGDIRQAGIAVLKRAYALVKEAGYRSQLMPAALRGDYHAFAVSGADMSVSIAANIQALLEKAEPPYEEHISEPIARDSLERLLKLPEFVRAYEPDGMKPSEFMPYGLTQRTLAQFAEAGWNPIQSFGLAASA